MHPRPRLVVVGSFNMDLMSRTPRLPAAGETILGGPFKMGPGGKGSNQAVAAARLGADVTMVVALGRDYYGDIALKNLVKEGVNCDGVVKVDDTHTGVALIAVDDSTGQNMIVVAAGANMRLTSDDVSRAERLIADSDCVLLQLEIPVETVERALLLAKRHGVTTVLNPAPGRELPEKLLGLVDVATPNETEAEAVTGLEVHDLEGAGAAGGWLLERGVSRVVLTLGENGALVVEPGMARHVPAFKVNVVDTTGAGDAFNGALAARLAVGDGILAAVRYANAAAAISVTRVGTAPSMATADEVDRFLAQAASRDSDATQASPGCQGARPARTTCRGRTAGRSQGAT